MNPKYSNPSPEMVNKVAVCWHPDLKSLARPKWKQMWLRLRGFAGNAEVWSHCLPARGCSSFTGKNNWDGWIAFGFIDERSLGNFVERCSHVEQLIVVVAAKNEWMQYTFHGPEGKIKK